MIHFKPFRFGRAERVTLLILASLIVLVIGIYRIPAVADWYTRVTDAWTAWAIQYGYFGAFMAALVGNLTIIIVFPYTVAIFFLATTGLDPIWLGVLTGTGAVLGEFSGYLIGRWGSHRFQRAKPEAYDALDRIVRGRPTSVMWLLFLFSSLPLPDDVLFIPLGMLRFPVWKLLWPAWLGKMIAGLAVAFFGSTLEPVLSGQPPTSPLALFSQLGSLVAVILVMYAIVKVDWTVMMHRLLNGKMTSATRPEMTP
ncbi:MAG: VTT domain-containing protein [Candidatus Kerfeldbacteria bacterium]|nr:VTT domain-containing protein [Candidatus Kerfeldbacteria bacterium]